MIRKACGWSVVASFLLGQVWPGIMAAQTITVDATPSQVANTFSPPSALGAAIAPEPHEPVRVLKPRRWPAEL